MEMNVNKKSLKNSNNRASDFVLNITANVDGNVHGKIEHCESAQTSYFRSLIEMIVLINGKLEELQFPQTTNELRSWVTKVTPICLKGGRKL